MDPKKLQERLEELEAQLLQQQENLEQARANCNAISGAMQEVQFWARELEKAGAEEKPEVDPDV